MRIMITCVAKYLIFAGCALNVLSARAASSINGFVTNVVSAREFRIGDLQILLDGQTKWKRPARAPLTWTLPRVGMLVHVEGKFHEGTIDAKSVEVEFQMEKKEFKLQGRALLQQAPALHPEGQGWAGIVWIEGYPLTVTPQTKLVTATGSDFPVAQIAANMWGSYQAERGPDGGITATQIVFEPNKVDQSEKEFRDKVEPKHIDANPVKRKPAELKFGALIPVIWELLPDQDVQDYVMRIGNSLVPQYQKDLPDSDLSKIDFRFYAVKAPPAGLNYVGGVIDLPNGIILIDRDFFTLFGNEAQFAARLSNCIAHVIEKQEYLHHKRLKADLYAQLGGIANIYGSPLAISMAIDHDKLIAEINQRCDRIGLAYMLHGGYDIREAPFAYRDFGDPQVNNPLTPNQDPPARFAKLMQEIEFDYADTDFSKLKKNTGAFDAIKTKATGKELALR